MANKKKKITKKPIKKVVKKITKKTVKKSQSKTKTSTAKSIKATKPIKIIDYSKVITPLADRLVVRVVEKEKVTAGGIIIPDSVGSFAEHLKGEVLAVGKGAKNKKGLVKALDVKLGDYVLFAQYAATKIEFNSEELQIIKETDVMGIVQK